jgi:UDP-N-acetylmuramoyl-tripeptide--D-alanyl-D-alanine ligase
VAKAKGELFAAVAACKGVSIINVDDHYAPLWRELAHGGSVLGFGFDAAADIRADDVTPIATGIAFTLRTPAGAERVALNLPGRHNVMNALAAAAAGHALGLSPRQIADGLSTVQPVAGRLNRLRTAEGAMLIDDSYNANPTSLKAALELLASLPGERRLVLGEMRELGPDAAAIHKQAGRDAKAAGIDRLYTLGALPRLAAETFGPEAQAFDDLDPLLGSLRRRLGPEVTVLVKGSRGARMERVVAALSGIAAGTITEGAH